MPNAAERSMLAARAAAAEKLAEAARDAERLALAEAATMASALIERFAKALKGKLSSSVAYKIDNKVITAKNHLLLDQFTLGKTVERILR